MNESTLTLNIDIKHQLLLLHTHTHTQHYMPPEKKNEYGYYGVSHTHTKSNQGLDPTLNL